MATAANTDPSSLVDTSLVPSLQATALDGSTETTLSFSPFENAIPTTITRSFEILGVETDCWVQLFGDRIMLGVSQLQGRVGTFVSCQAEESVIDGGIRFNISVLLGKRNDDMLGVYARRVMDRILKLRTSLQDASPPLLLAISLEPQKEKDPAMFSAIVDVLVQLYQEAIQTASRGA